MNECSSFKLIAGFSRLARMTANPDKRDKYLHEIRFKKEETNF
jgi:hypothetical protein